MEGVTREGYTFQTVLGSMGLNHMNGRIEDSVTGRFLSPDPRGTIRGNTQSWNRYSYVNNNPLTFTDPTGFSFKRCSDFCPTNSGNKMYFDTGCLGPTSGFTSSISDGMQVPTGGNYSSEDTGPSIGSIGYDGQNGGPGIGGAVPNGTAPPSTVELPGVGTRPATNSVTTDANGFVTIVVDIYSPDAPPKPTPNGINTAPYWQSTTYRSYQGSMNTVTNIFFLEISVFNPAVADALTAIHLSQLSPSQQTMVACTVCALSFGAQDMEYANLIAELSGEPIPFQEVNLGPEIETPVQSGNEAFDEALSRVIWGNNNNRPASIPPQ